MKQETISGSVVILLSPSCGYLCINNVRHQ